MLAKVDPTFNLLIKRYMYMYVIETITGKKEEKLAKETDSEM